MAQIKVVDALGAQRDAALVSNTGQTSAANSLPVVVASDQIVPVSAQNILNKFREAFETYDPAGGGRWAETKAPGDIIVLEGNAAAASYLAISKDPLTAGGISTIETVARFGSPFEAAVGLHMSQRTLGQEFSVELVGDETPLATPADLAISSISQATTTLTVNTTLAHNLKPGMRVGIRDCVDPRVNYPALVVASIPSTTQFTATAGPGGTIPSLTIGPFTSGFVFQRSALGLAPNGASAIFENATATNASFYVRSESGDALPSGTILGNHAITTLSTVSVQAINAAFTYAFQPTAEFRLSQMVDGIQWSDSQVDTLAASNGRYKRTQVVPDIAVDYKLRVRATNNPSLTRPNAQIVSIVKTGTTTATVTTDVAHGLTVSDLVVLYGARDQTNFPNLLTATAVASVVSTTQFTIVIGSAVTATSYGGFVARVNGGNLMSALGASAIVAQSIVRTSNVLTVTGNGSWTGLSIGDFVNLIGCRDNATGASLGVDGPYRVANVATTALTLEPINSTVSPTGTDIVSTNCGGAIIKRTCLRLSYIRVLDFERQRVEMMPRPQGDISAAASVNVQNTPAVTVSSGTVTAVTTVSTVAAVTTAGTPAAPTDLAINSAASTNGQLVNGGTTGLQALFASNTGAAVAFVKLYNKATAPTVGTDVPVMIIPVPAAVSGVPGIVELTPAFNGYRFPLGLGLAITGLVADSDTTAVAAGQVKVKLSRTA